MLALLIMSMLTLMLNIQTVKGWTGMVTIKADGSLSQPNAPISSADNVTYVLSDSIFGSIIVQRDDIIIDGAGYMLQGTGRERSGMDFAERTNVTVQNTQIQNFTAGIGLRDSFGISIIGNNITANRYFGIDLHGSSSNIIIGNIITNNYYGIHLYSSSNNSIIGNTISNSFEGIMGASSSNYNNVSRNTVTHCDYGVVFNENSFGNGVIGNILTDNGDGVVIDYSSNNVISDNNITANTRGIYLHYSSNNIIIGNNITKNDKGIWLRSSYDNKFYHNYFVYNLQQVGVEITGFANVWDNGFPSGGNYWSNYAGPDDNKDGFGDVPYVIDVKNADRYPLMISPSILDTELPILSVTYPYPGEVIKESEVTISWEGADYASGINHYEITIDDEYSINVGLNTSYTFTELDNGQHVVRIAAFDYAGNTVYQSLDFSIDAGIRFAWPPYTAEALVTIAMVIALGIALYVLKSRYSSRIQKPDRRLIR